ncbi:hypothetical protein [Blastopirellula marina]|uniref:Uncharacterized protein n=1 Tax=Blastopirellula marina TaxID=124 RepID=A0A2S8GJ90_9BACT|nr:hypothetical protein [Blastopirellula marina]PQO44430.1 hypothetical protein C5Y93_18620 [Blastopirellula marina]
MLAAAGVGALIAGTYGIIHDQITYSISPEYFTKMKFQQFHYADFGWGNRVFAGTIGFLATWWAGLFAGWLLARRFVPGQSLDIYRRKIALGMGIVFGVTLLFSLGGYGYGLWRGPGADYAAWKPLLRSLKIEHGWAFLRVAYIHNAGYLGALTGLVLALLVIRPGAGKIESKPSNEERS